MPKSKEALLDWLKVGGVGLHCAGAELLFAVLIAGLSLFAAGCGKKEQGQGTTPPAGASQPAQLRAQPGQAPAAPQVYQPVTTLAQSNGAVDLPELQRCVIRWVVANQRRPNSFEDFAATAGVQIPPPPAGKKYLITHDLHVQLVNQ